jgi:gliding motility-associated protein GldM
MINLMYLVLTALLALNVSAEVMNAFFTLDEGNQASIQTVDTQLSATVKGVKDLLSDESKRKYKPIEPAIDAVRAKIAEFNEYVNVLRDDLIDSAGDKDGSVGEGDYTVSYGKRVPKGKKNKDITTRMLVDEGKGEELKNKIIETKDDILKAYTDLLTDYGDTFGLKKPEIDQRIASMSDNLPLKVDDESWKEVEGKNSWADFKFRQMPLAAVLPLMSQMQSDSKSSEAALINAMAELTGGRVIEFDQFFPVVQAKKAYVISGEPFEAKISVGTYSSQIQPENIKLYANGSLLKVGEDGTAEFTTSTGKIGPQSISLKAEVTNPLTGEVSEGEATYDYEVGLRSVTVSADKMNVFYIGVDNPVSVAAAGVPTSSLRVGMSGGGGKIKRSGSGYMVTVDKPGEAKITVSGDGVSQSFPFRVKRIPDPVARLSKKAGGTMGNGEFKAQGGVGAFLDGFDFDAKCNIQGYNLVYVAKRQDPVEAVNKGGRYNDKSKRLVMKAKPGDIYYFDNVKARCPGDKVGRPINSMVFKIK